MEETVVVKNGSERNETVIFYFNRKFTFQKELAGGIKRWSCAAKWKYKCKAYLKTVGTTVVESSNVHNHLAAEDEKDMCALRAGVKRKASEDVSLRPSKIVRTVLQEQPNPNINVRQLKGLKQLAYRTKRKSIPTLPKSIDEVLSVLQTMDIRTSKAENFLLLTNEKHIVIFTCETNVRCLVTCNRVYMDGTFDYSPKFFVQLFTIHGYKQGLYVPLVFCLLPGKGQDLYESCLQSLNFKAREMLGQDLRPNTCVIDYEQAIHNAAHIAWPGVRVVGCKFHIAQAWFRRIQKLGLTSAYKDKEDEVGVWLHWAFGLPLLNPQEVGEVFSKWLLERPTTHADSTVAFTQYLHDTYVADNAKFPPSLWASKTGDTTMTTNACESFHAHFKHSFTSPHPNIFVFVEALVAYQTEVYVKVHDTEDHVPSAQSRRRSRWINTIIARQSPEDDLYLYVKRVSTHFGGILDRRVN